MEKNKKERKLPNRTDIPIDITEVVAKKQKEEMQKKGLVTYPKTFTFTATSVPSDWLNDRVTVKEGEYPPEMQTAPWFYTPRERKASEIANLRIKARHLLDKTFSAGNTYNEFGAVKFPSNVKVQCYRCGNMMEYVVDFFIHGVLDHGSTLRDVEEVFQGLLNRI